MDEIIRGRKDVSEVDREVKELRAATASANYDQLDIYVSDANGSDVNTGMSPADPLKTLEAAYALVPALLAAPVVIHMASGTYAAPQMPVWQPISPSGALYVYGDGAGQVGDDGFVEVATGSVDSITDGVRFDVTGGGLTEDEWLGYTLEVTSGTDIGARRTIRFNGTDEVQTSGILDNLAATDTFRVIRPAVIWDIPLDDFALLQGVKHAPFRDEPSNQTWWVNLRLTTQGTTNAERVFRIVNSSIGMLGVETENARISGSSSRYWMGATGDVDEVDAEARILGPLGVPTGTATLWEGWGLGSNSISQGTSHLISSQGLEIYGFLVQPQMNLILNDVAYLSGGRISRQMTVSQGAEIRIGTSAEFLVRGAHTSPMVRASIAGKIYVTSGLVVEALGSGSGAGCIDARTQGFVQLDSGSGDDGFCTDASAYAVDAQEGGIIYFDGAPQYLGVAGNDCRVGSTVRAVAFYTGAGIGDVDNPLGSRIVRNT